MAAGFLQYVKGWRNGGLGETSQGDEMRRGRIWRTLAENSEGETGKTGRRVSPGLERIPLSAASEV